MATLILLYLIHLQTAVCPDRFESTQQLQISIKNSIQQLIYSQNDKQEGADELGLIFACADNQLPLEAKKEIFNLFIEKSTSQDTQTRKASIISLRNYIVDSSKNLTLLSESSSTPIPREKVITVLTEQLEKDTDKGVRSSLIGLLKGIVVSNNSTLKNSEKKQISDSLVKQLIKEDNIENQSNIIDSIGEIGSSAKDTFPSLTKDIVLSLVDFFTRWRVPSNKDENLNLSSICDTSRQAFAKMGIESQRSIPQLLKIWTEEVNSKKNINNSELLLKSYIDCHSYIPRACFKT